MRLASGDWSAALDAYWALLQRTAGDRERAELLRGMAEALCRLSRGVDAIGPAKESVDLFESCGSAVDEVYAAYWVGYAQYLMDDVGQARATFARLLGRVRSGIDVHADFEVRLLTAAALVETWDGRDESAFAYMQEARPLVDRLEASRRAAYLMGLARMYQAAGDLEAALLAASDSLSLFCDLDSQADVALLENQLATIYLELGNTTRAEAHVLSARNRAEKADATRLLAHITDTEAQIALARGDLAAALGLVEQALRRADRASNDPARVAALVTRARIELGRGSVRRACASFEEAAAVLRARGPRGRLRQILAQWADILAQAGQHSRANELYREALGLGSESLTGLGAPPS